MSYLSKEIPTAYPPHGFISPKRTSSHSLTSLPLLTLYLPVSPSLLTRIFSEFNESPDFLKHRTRGSLSSRVFRNAGFLFLRDTDFAPKASITRLFTGENKVSHTKKCSNGSATAWPLANSLLYGAQFLNFKIEMYNVISVWS